MSADLQWLLLRGNNSFIVKRVVEGPIFSKEPGNLVNIHSHKYSGLANAKTVHVVDSGSVLKVETRKKSASQHAVKSARVTTTIRRRSGPRRSLGVAAQFAKAGYRPDLRKAVLARVSALQSAQKEPKPTPEKKLRGHKAQVSA